MDQANLIIIAGCNGAGKTTAAYKILSESLEGIEFVNADEIARDLRIDNPNSTDIEAGRAMLRRIHSLLNLNESFAIETTLASKSLKRIILLARNRGYYTTLIYFWLDSPGLAINRVSQRVLEGGHDIPKNVIRRRYLSGLVNLFELYIPNIDYWMIFDNSGPDTEFVAEGYLNKAPIIKISRIFTNILELYEKETR